MNDFPNCQQVPARCRWCGAELLLQIDADYMAMGDHLKLIEIAVCNRCADLRVQERDIHDSIRKIAITLALLPAKLNPDGMRRKATCFDLLRELCKRYAQWLKSKHRLPAIPRWEDLVKTIFEDPAPADNWYNHIRGFRQFHQQPQHQTYEQRETFHDP